MLLRVQSNQLCLLMGIALNAYLERWDMQGTAHRLRIACLPNLGGFMEGADEFDADLFKTSQTEAVLMDPQHRQLLEMLFHARSAEDWEG